MIQLLWSVNSRLGVPEKYYGEGGGGGGGPKFELNPKPKKIPILGQFGTLKNTVFFLLKHRRS